MTPLLTSRQRIFTTSPRSQAFLVPVSAKFSRNASRSVVRGSIVIVRGRVT
jgi:hypothetical protein